MPLSGATESPAKLLASGFSGAHQVVTCCVFTSVSLFPVSTLYNVCLKRKGKKKRISPGNDGGTAL